MRRHRSKPSLDASVTESALDAMDAAELRALIRDMLPWFDDTLHARFVDALVDRAARTTSDWVPRGPTDDALEEVEAFAKAARRAGHAEPSEVDACLRQGSSASSRKGLPGRISDLSARGAEHRATAPLARTGSQVGSDVMRGHERFWRTCPLHSESGT